jgi:hypothetical protein
MPGRGWCTCSGDARPRRINRRWEGRRTGDVQGRGVEIGDTCRAYTPGTHARKEEDRVLPEFPCNPIRTRSV